MNLTSECRPHGHREQYAQARTTALVSYVVYLGVFEITQGFQASLHSNAADAKASRRLLSAPLVTASLCVLCMRLCMHVAYFHVGDDLSLPVSSRSGIGKGLAQYPGMHLLLKRGRAPYQRPYYALATIVVQTKSKREFSNA